MIRFGGNIQRVGCFRSNICTRFFVMVEVQITHGRVSGGPSSPLRLHFLFGLLCWVGFFFFDK